MKTTQSPKSDWQLFLYFIRYLKPIWDKVLLVVLLAIVLTVLDINTVVLPLVTKKFIDQVLGQHDWYMFKILLIVLITQIVLFLSCNYLLELNKYVVSMKLGIRMGMDVFKHVLTLPLSFFQKRPVGEHMYRVGTTFDPGFANLAILGLLFETTGSAKGETQPFMGNDVDTVLSMITQSLDLIIRVTFRLLLILFTVTYGINFKVGMALIVFCVPYIAIIHLFYNIQRRIDLRYREKSQNFLAGLQEWFAGIKTVKAFGKGKYEVLKNIRLYIRMLRVEWQNFFMKLATDNFILFFRYAFIVGAILYMLVVEKQTTGAVVALFLLLDQFFSPINQYVRVVEGIRLQLIPARRLMETVGVEPDIREKSDALSLPKFSGPYKVNRVKFSYEPEKPILKNVTLEIPRGQRIGIVGASGSGKTSLVNLLMRFYDPDSGEILLDKVNLRDVKLNNYYQNIGIILQEDFLFSGTVRENIRYGKPDSGEEEVYLAAKLAAVHEDILRLPNGYDTDLGEGTKLSGGQRQRIAIARALIRQPNILILDEATSSLDSETARRIEETIFEAGQEKTIVMITHKLLSVRQCDKIFVIENGELVEQGAFEELLEKDGLFASLYRKQVAE
ncbi:MAG: ABC transporter ATP-binding protein [Calditrichaeota bacterium]|nr:ABC transporter ATP-binding protein [Calditrichota bacterium]